MNLNKIFLIGRLTRDPESRALPSGQTVSNFGLATNRVWTNPETSEKQEQVEFHNIVAFGRLADICNQYLSKGSLIMIEGRIQTRSWQDQNGDTKYRTEIITETMQMGPRGGQAGRETKETESEAKEEVQEVQVNESGEEKVKEKKKNPEGDEVKSEDIPF
jgi:single-strand DNA-binding protein